MRSGSTELRCDHALAHLAGHDKQRLHLEALVVGTEPVDVVLLSYIHDFFRGRDGVDGQVVVTAVPEDNQPSVDFAQQQVEGEITVGHRNNGVNGIGIAAADQVAKLLVDDVDRLAHVVFGRKLLQFFRYQVSNPPKFFVTKGVGGLGFENHLSALEHRSF